MSIKKDLRIFIRLIFWLFYLSGGYILFLKKGFLPNYFIDFAKVVYPLSIFWLQIRINKKEKWFQINPAMSTAQLWYKIIPVISSFCTSIITSINFLLFLINLL